MLCVLPCASKTEMPSAEEPTYLIEMVPDTTQDFLSRDVDLLVSQIKENLQLSDFKAKSSISHKNRPSPYWIPSRSLADQGNCEVSDLRGNGAALHDSHLHQQHKRTASEGNDPYELLQELLREGGLIKEAVKRLQANAELQAVKASLSDGKFTSRDMRRCSHRPNQYYRRK